MPTTGCPGRRALPCRNKAIIRPPTNIEKVMAPDRYAFWYEGAPWKEAEWRGIKPGDLRDGGSLKERAAHVAYWHQWPDEYDYLVSKWDEFLSA